MSPCYSLDARLITSRTCEQNAEIQCSSGLSLAIIWKNRKRRLALHTALRTGYQRRQLLLHMLTNIWSTSNVKRFKDTIRISRSTFMFLLGCIRNAIEKDTITEEIISPEAPLAICLYRKCHSQKRNCLCTAHAHQGGEIAFGRWGSRYFCDVCADHHI